MDIYVGNLPYEAEESVLEQAFAEFGQVENVKIIRDFETGRSKGFGFVTMPDDGEGQEAIDAMNGADFEGRALKVNMARPREERPNRGGSGGGGGGGGRGGNRGGDFRRGGGGRDRR